MGLKENAIPFLGSVIAFIVLKRNFVFVEIIDYLIIVGIIIFIYAGLFYIVKELKNEKTVKKSADKVFVFLIFAVLITPVVKFNLADRTIEENRMLKVFPKFEGFSSNKGNYFKGIEGWFNDRFNQRDRLIKYSYRLDHKINGGFFSETAFMGKDYWIFTKDRNSIGNFQKTTYFRKSEVDRLKANLVSRQKWLEKQGIKYYLMIAPDKNVVYGEHYLDNIKVIGKESQIDQLFNTVKNQTDIPIVYPWQAVKAEKDKALLYYKMDTHWTNYGAFFGYRELMKLVKSDFPTIPVVTEKELEFNKKKVEFGDMLRMFHLKKGSYPEIKYKLVNVDKFSKNVKEEYYLNNHKIIKVSSGVNDLTAIVFRDSFTNGMKDYLSQSFGTIYLVWDHHKFNNYQKFIVEHKPDLVIHETLARLTSVWMQDTPKLEEVEDFGI